MKIKYAFLDGTTTEVEVSDEIGDVIIDSRKAEHARTSAIVTIATPTMPSTTRARSTVLAMSMPWRMIRQNKRPSFGKPSLN